MGAPGRAAAPILPRRVAAAQRWPGTSPSQASHTRWLSTEDLTEEDHAKVC